MAEIFRPHYHVDPATGKRVNAGAPGAVRKKSKTWWIRYYTPDGVRHKVAGYPDKKATESKAAELERRGIRLAEGIIEPSDVHAKRPLAEHAKDFIAYLEGKGNVVGYVSASRFRLTAILDGCRFVKIGDVQASAIVDFLAGLRDKGKSAKTLNDYVATAKGFTRWLHQDKRSAMDPLAGLSRFANPNTDVRHARRDLATDELRRLLDATRTSRRMFRKLSGIDRHALYLTACATGFRVSELASMTPDSFKLDGDAPTATVQAACTKNRKLAVQPLPVDVAEALRGYLASKPAGALVWSGTWTVKAAKMIRGDLKQARKEWLQSFQNARQRSEAEQSDFLAYQDAEGRYVDFHALRHSFITMIGKAGVSPREHQDLARHSSYALTSRYSHSRFYDLAAAVQALPIPTDGRESKSLPATGTDGKSVDNARSPSISLGPNLGPRSAKTADFGGQARTETACGECKENTGKTKENLVFPVQNGTVDKVGAIGFEPMTPSVSS